MKVCFLLESASISGGTNVIFQHAGFLRRLGVHVTIALNQQSTAQDVSWHPEAKLLDIKTIEQACQGTYTHVIATWWRTTLLLPKFRSISYVYFVQSIESRFYPSSEIDLVNIVNKTYDLDIHFITIATWIQQYLYKYHRKHSYIVRNGIQKDLFCTFGSTITERPKSTPRILVEGSFGVSFKNTALAIKIAREAGFNDVWVLTGSNTLFVPGATKVFSKVPLQKTPDIYRSCDILLKLSTVEGMFGPPLEMFHCGGTSVVLGVTGHDEYIINDFNSIVCDSSDLDSVVNKLRTLVDNPILLQNLKAGAKVTAEQWPSWEQSSEEFYNCLAGLSPHNIDTWHNLRSASTYSALQLSIYENDKKRRNPRITLFRELYRLLLRRAVAHARLLVHTARVCREVWTTPRKVRF